MQYTGAADSPLFRPPVGAYAIPHNGAFHPQAWVFAPNPYPAEAYMNLPQSAPSAGVVIQTPSAEVARQRVEVDVDTSSRGIVLSPSQNSEICGVLLILANKEAHPAVEVNHSRAVLKNFAEGVILRNRLNVCIESISYADISYRYIVVKNGDGGYSRGEPVIDIGLFSKGQASPIFTLKTSYKAEHDKKRDERADQLLADALKPVRI